MSVGSKRSGTRQGRGHRRDGASQRRDDGLEHPDGKPVHGRDAFRDFHRQFRSAISDIHIKVEPTLTQGDMTMAQCVVTGVHSGPGLGIAPTNKPVKFTGMCLARLKDGKLAEAWNNFDLASMYRQIQ